ncbi:MAG: DUF1002 domain-containing protein [Alkalibacterium sp.]|nr:DUF1002 domain-containing protein [Alkalibacterium sp.]
MRAKKGLTHLVFDQAIVEIKQQLAELRDQQGELATREDIERIINEALENNDLQNIISQEQINRLLAFFERYQQTGAIDSAQVREQLENLSDNIRDRFGDVWQDAEDSGSDRSDRQFLPADLGSNQELLQLKLKKTGSQF